MQTRSYADFVRGLDRDAARNRIPLSGTIEVTRRCPNLCVHCYNNLALSDVEARRRELTTAEHYRLLDDITRAGCLWLLYTGGEIFVRPDFLSIYTYAKRKGLLITLFTNGTRITPKVADHLATYPPHSIEISLYGATQATYEQVTGVPGSYDQCLRGIQLLADRGLPLKLKTVGLTVNRDEIQAMQRFAHERGMDFTFDAQINPRIDCALGPLTVRLAPEGVVALDFENPKRLVEWRRLAAEFSSSGPPDSRRALYACGAGVTSFAVDPYGMLSLCVISHQHAYDLRAGSFEEGWNAFLRKERGRESARSVKCQGCSLHVMCGMCPANGELENGDPESPVDFLCRTAHLRAYGLGLSVAPHGTCEYCVGGSGYRFLLDSARLIRGASHAGGPATAAKAADHVGNAEGVFQGRRA